MGTTFKETKIGRIPEEWSIANLSEVAELRHGYQFREYDFTQSGIAVIKIGNLIDGNLYLDDVTFIDANRLPEFNNYVVRNGDLLMSLTGNIGRVVEVKGLGNPVLQNYRVGHFSPRAGRLTKQYLKHALSSELLTRQMNKFANQTAQANFGKKDLDKLFLSYPASLPEQRKIAEILSTVDETIEKTDAIIRETQQLKKGLMQKLFTEGIGHTRFKETKIGRIEYGTIPIDWDEVELSSICNVTSSKRIMMHEYVDSGIPFYRSKEIIEKMMDISHDKILYISESRFQDISRKFGAPQNGDILMTAVGSLGIPYLIDDDENFYFKDGNLLWLRDISGEIDKRFLIYYFESFGFKKVIEVITAGSSQKALTIEKLEKLRIPLPNSSEQQMITQILSEVDAKIETEQAFKTELEQLKKGLMQVLLTGKVRVKV